MSRGWRRLILFTVAVSAVSLALGPVLWLRANDQRHAARLDNARSTLANCRQVEALKAQLLGTINDSIKERERKGPPLTGRELAQVHRLRVVFGPDDCFANPVVKGAGLKPPKGR